MGMEALSLVKRFPGVKVLCLGDIMLDRYIYGVAERISPEAPVPVVHVRRHMLIPGGVGNVAKNLVAFGVVPLVVGMVGDDPSATLLLEQLRETGKIRCSLVRDASRPTIVKTRVIAGIQQIVRFDEEIPEPVSDASAQAILAAVEKCMDEVGAVALSDYGKGLLTPQLTQAVIRMAASRKRPVVVDPKGFDYEKYAGADLVKPNRKELGEAVGRVVKTDNEVVEAGRLLMRRYKVRNVLVTLSEKGMLLFREEDGGETPFPLPSRAREVYDVTGAGDTVLACLAAAMAVGAELPLGARLATLAAGVVVGKVGTATADVEELERAAREEWGQS